MFEGQKVEYGGNLAVNAFFAGLIALTAFREELHVVPPGRRFGRKRPALLRWFWAN